MHWNFMVTTSAPRSLQIADLRTCLNPAEASLVHPHHSTVYRPMGAAPDLPGGGRGAPHAE
jgi:hypothetical protein